MDLRAGSSVRSHDTKFIIFGTKFIIFDTKFIIFGTKFIIFGTKFIIFDTKFIISDAKFIIFNAKFTESLATVCFVPTPAHISKNEESPFQIQPFLGLKEPEISLKSPNFLESPNLNCVHIFLGVGSVLYRWRASSASASAIFDTKSIILNTNFIIFDTKSIILNTKFIIF